jgi:hypothetical protein
MLYEEGTVKGSRGPLPFSSDMATRVALPKGKRWWMKLKVLKVMNRRFRTFLSVSLGLLLPGLSNQVQAQSVSRLTAWGNNDFGQTIVPPDLTNTIAIASGLNHNLALSANGTVRAWGNSSAGQVIVPPGLSNVVAVAGGYQHSLALKSDGTLVPWGYGAYGLTTVPSGLTNVESIAAGGYFNLVVKRDGTVAGWGSSDSGQLNVPPGLSNVTAVAGGLLHSLALRRDGTVVGWGNNSLHQLDIPPALSDVVAIAAGNYHSLALRANGTVAAWGYNNYGQLSVPAGLTNVVAIACGTYYCLVLKANGTVVGWGDNSYGQAQSTAGLTNVVALSAGQSHSLALGGFPPQILNQPQDVSVPEFSSAAFSVSAAGSPPPQYQWQLNGTNLAGATASSFTLASVQASNAGSYSVRVYNTFGSVTSAPALLTIQPLLVVRCASVVVSANENCQANASVDNGSYDPTGSPLTLTQSPAGPYPLGTNLVTLTGSSERGGSASCSALVIVLDRTPPQITPPADQVVSNAPGQCGAVVSFSAPSASDSCSAVTRLICTPEPGSFFPAGTTTVECAATDAAGNVGITNFTVTVLDREAPSIACPADIVVTNAHNTWARAVTYTPAATDNCPGLGAVICSPPSGSVFAPGTHTVNCSVTDAAGNSTTGSFRVTVRPGNQPPRPVIELAPLLVLPGLTNPTVLATNGKDTGVLCDGSSSSDPDDAFFHSGWFFETQCFSTNLLAIATLPVGIHTLTLALDDTFPYGTSTASAQVEVISPERAIEVLGEAVENSGLGPNAQKALLTSLAQALASAEKQNFTAAANQLGAFENKVQAQLGRSEPALADTLCQAAQALAQALKP